MKTGIELIVKERQRQIEKEGWTAKHDNQHQHGELLNAAICYAMNKEQRDYGANSDLFDLFWDWDIGRWKPTPNDRVRELTKAGALIAAEIDRLQRIK